MSRIRKLQNLFVLLKSLRTHGLFRTLLALANRFKEAGVLQHQVYLRVNPKLSTSTTNFDKHP